VIPRTPEGRCREDVEDHGAIRIGSVGVVGKRETRRADGTRASVSCGGSSGIERSVHRPLATGAITAPLRGRVTARGGDARNRLGNWGFAQLGGFIVYEARLAGVAVEFIDPAYTSRTCHECGHCERSNRRGQERFHCRGCGHRAHADVNAARNIRARALSKRAPGLGNQPGDRVA
jgi:transposase